MNMDTNHPGPEEALARDVEKRDRDLKQRERADTPQRTVDLIAGLVAGMRPGGPAATKGFAPTPAELHLAQMVVVWRQGEAAKHDPVLVNVLARHAAILHRVAPGAAERVQAAFEDTRARGVPFCAAAGERR